MRFRLFLAAGAWVLLSIGVQSRAGAAAPWTARSIVLPRGDLALDFGLGLGHAPTGP